MKQIELGNARVGEKYKITWAWDAELVGEVAVVGFTSQYNDIGVNFMKVCGKVITSDDDVLIVKE